MRDLETNLNRSRVNIPSSPELSGEIDFDYSDYNGFHLIGTGLSEFMTRWSGASRDSIHSYTDKTNISIALAPPAFSLKDLSKVDSFNFSSRVRSPRLREFLVLENHHGRYGVIQILGLQSRSHGDNFDRVRLRYWLLEDGTADFTKFA